MNMTELARRCFAEQGVSEEEILKQSMEFRPNEFLKKGTDVFAKA